MNIIDLVNVYIGKIPFVDKIPYAAVLVPAVVAIISIIFANYGKKLLNVLKFVVCAGACYYLGSVILWAHVGKFLEPHGVTSLVAGIALAVVGALLSKFAYAIVFAGALAYVAYLYAPVENTITLIVVAAGVGVIALIFRGLLETVLTSIGGGAGFSVGLYATLVAITDLLNLGANGTGIKFNGSTLVLGPLTFEMVVLVVVAVLVCLAGYIHQVKNRHRY